MTSIFNRLRSRTHNSIAQRETPVDYACPECGSQDDLSVMFVVKARLRRCEGQDRPDTPDMTRWTDGNGMCCGDCGWRGAAGSARVDRLAS